MPINVLVFAHHFHYFCSCRYSVDQMYDIVADVGSYQLFVPWCNCSRIISLHNEVSKAELEVGFPPVVERYVSEISSVPHCQIRVMHDIRMV